MPIVSSRSLSLGLVLLAAALATTGCPPVRGGSGGGGGGGGGGANGVFSWYSYGYGYSVGRLLVTRDDADDCDTVDGYFYDDDYDYLRATLYKGEDVSWEGEYDDLYDESGACYGISEEDFPTIHCLGELTDCTGEEGCSSSYGAEFRISSYSDARVVGSATIEGETTAFSVHNCGESGYEGRSQPSGLPRAEGTSTVPAKRTIQSAWGLRFK